MLKTCLMGVALVLSGAMAAMAQTPPENPGEYWLGIECFSLPSALRAQLDLPIREGLLVEAVVPESPAAKAGIARHDVLMRAGGKPLADPRDLIEAIEAAKDGKLKIELIHGGKSKTVEAAPAKRPDEARRRPATQPLPGDWEAMQKWIERMYPEGGAGGMERPPMHFRMFRPGAIVPRGVFATEPLPPNMSVAISKEGSQPAKIAARRGDEKWEVTEKELDKLPADVRPHVERMLGRGPLGIVGGPGAVDVFPEPPAPDRAHGPGAWEGRIEKRLDEMARRIDRIIESMDEMAAGHAQHMAPEKPAEK